MTDEQWQGVITNNATYDGQFFYGVRTTKIFCRPSCKSRAPKRENVELFHSKEEALAAGFRACKRCKSGGEKVPDDEWTFQIKAYLENNYNQSITLEKIAEECHGSQYHLHRVFKRQTGTTPLEYLHHIRIQQAQYLLKESTVSISKIAEQVGIPNSGQFATLFKKVVGETPNHYRQRVIREESGL